MELFSGSLLFAAVFLLPEPATMPGRWHSRLLVGAIAGGIAILLRNLGSFEETVVFAILLANAALPLLYRIQSEIHQQREFRASKKAEEMEARNA
jgi:electron transport complex protein RnfD